MAAFLEHLVARASPLLEELPSLAPDFWVRLLSRLAESPLEDVALAIPEAVDFLAAEKRKALREFVEELYNHWRSFNRFMVVRSEPGPGGLDRGPYRAFNATLETLVHLVRGTYRGLYENVTGDHPRIYRQVPAGCNIGLIAVPKACPLPSELREAWLEVPFIR